MLGKKKNYDTVEKFSCHTFRHLGLYWTKVIVTSMRLHTRTKEGDAEKFECKIYIDEHVCFGS